MATTTANSLGSDQSSLSSPDLDGNGSAPRLYGNPSLASRISMFQEQAEKHLKKQANNPFSNYEQARLQRMKINKNDPNYGKPEEGSKTAARGMKAQRQIEDETRMLCGIIKEYGFLNHQTGTYDIEFGELFQLYTGISNKVVGILLRARKHGYVQFDGEMLYQRQDDRKIISLLKMPEGEYNVQPELITQSP